MKENILETTRLGAGFEIIDNQHSVLFDLIKDLDNAGKNSVNPMVVDTLLGVFRDYVFMHFKEEEDLLVNSTEYSKHCLEHYALIKKLNSFIYDFRRNQTKETQPPSVFLEDWLVDHIEKFDKPCFAKGPAKASILKKSEAVDVFQANFVDKRKHKRIRRKDVVDDTINVHCYNATKLKSGKAEVVNLSSGGLLLSCSSRHDIGDLLVVSCSIGKNFHLKEKVKVVSIDKQQYGVKFLTPASKTLMFITELYGSLHMSKTNF